MILSIPYRLLPALLVLGLGGCEAKEEASFEEYQTMCAALEDQGSCNAAPGFNPDENSGAACQWELWVPVEVDGDACVFGEAIGTCFAEGYGDYRAGACGYTGPQTCTGEEYSVIHRQTENGLELSKQFFYCEEPTSVCTGAPEDPAECQCACDSEFPES